jgi:glycyl-tRNA synthetase
MRWRDPQLSFTRPIRWLLALWGNEVVPVRAGILPAGRTTRLLRTAGEPEVAVGSAEELLDRLTAAGIAVDQAARRAAILDGARALAPGVDADAALVDQITYLVEAPTPLLGRFDPGYLDLPEAVLATVMRKHQRYLPVRDGSGALQPCFVAIANGPVDVDRVRAGNEAVLRARYEDAAFFYRADLRVPLTTMRDRLATLTFTDRLGSMLARADRIAALAGLLDVELDPDDRRVLDRARGLVKVDLGSQMVTELTSLAGIMAREYARAAGEPEAVATALFEAELPRQAGDALPESLPGALLSLADRFDFLVGLAATVGLPTGSGDPFAVRRAALGLIAVHRHHPALADLPLSAGLALAADRQPVAVAGLDEVRQFLAGRLEQVLTEEGHPVDRVRAALVHADRPGRVDAVLAQLDKLVDRPEFRRLAEALQRARRIVPAGTPPAYEVAALSEPAELALHTALAQVGPTVDLEEFTAATTGLALAVAGFFDQVLVMADDPAVRAARLGLLASVAGLGSPVLAWDQLRLA